jgi:recombination protein RecA
MTLSFLKDFKKAVNKLDSVLVGIGRPQEWLTTGNYALNYILTGDWNRGIPLGRSVAFVGPSGSGKSFLTSNAIKHAQLAGYHVLALDSENALDMDYLGKIGAKVDEDSLTYAKVTTIEDVNSVCAEFFKGYVKAYGKDNPDSPRILIILDSLAMLASTTEMENYEGGGVIKGDQGQLAKRRKAMLKLIHGQLAMLPISFVFTDHVYNQDVMMGDGAWAITNSVKFFPSIIGLVTKLKLKEGTEVVGVRMRVEAYKSRFTKASGKIELEVPYGKGMSPFTGLVDLLENLGVIVKSDVPGKKQGWMMSNGPIDGEVYFFRPNEMTHEDAAKLFKHPKAACYSMDSGEEDELAKLLASDKDEE